MLIYEQKKIGTLPKETPAGPFADDWKKSLGGLVKEGFEEVDISSALSSAAFAAKDENELVIQSRVPPQDCETDRGPAIHTQWR